MSKPLIGFQLDRDSVGGGSWTSLSGRWQLQRADNGRWNIDAARRRQSKAAYYECRQRLVASGLDQQWFTTKREAVAAISLMALQPKQAPISALTLF
jgi:hypothetical protein